LVPARGEWTTLAEAACGDAADALENMLSKPVITDEQKLMEFEDRALELTVEYAPKHEYTDPDDGTRCFSALGFARDLLKALTVDNAKTGWRSHNHLANVPAANSENRIIGFVVPVSTKWPMACIQEQLAEIIEPPVITPQTGDIREEYLNFLREEGCKATDAACIADLKEKRINKIRARLHAIAGNWDYTIERDRLRKELAALIGQAGEPIAWIDAYALRCLKGNATAKCAPQGMRDDGQNIPLYEEAQSRYQLLYDAGEALLAAGHNAAYDVIYRMMEEVK
jgi:hypothetical protein